MTALKIQTARAFLPLLKPSRYKALYGGRGSAKSHFFDESLIERCIMFPGARIACVREVQKSLKESVKLLIEDKIRAFGIESSFKIRDERIETPGNGIIVFQGMADHTAESVKSLEGFDIGYVEEAQTLTAKSLETLRPTIRGRAGRPPSELWFSWNPRSNTDPVDQFFRGPIAPPDSIIQKVSYKDNPWFPDELEKERAYDEINNPARYGHVWLGEYEPQAVGALWTREIIHRNRVFEKPRMSRILVSIDPPISNNPGSDEAGIVVGGIGEDGQGYVLDDVSLKGSPTEWAERAVAVYDLHEADAIIAEVNQGGDMVESTIHSVRPGIRVIQVRATRGKHLRAEPIASLYSLNRIHHVGAFPKLEAQMCMITVSGYDGEGSPDRVDSMVHLFTELFPKMTRRVIPKDKPRPITANNRYNPLRPHARVN